MNFLQILSQQSLKSCTPLLHHSKQHWCHWMQTPNSAVQLLPSFELAHDIFLNLLMKKNHEMMGKSLCTERW